MVNKEVPYGVIYQATNKINKKIYIGKTTHKRFDSYKKQHIKNALSNIDKSRRSFYSAIRKYGEDSFDWVILKTCFSKDELYLEEINWIALLKSNTSSCGYNMTKGGDGGDTYCLMDEYSKKARRRKAQESGKERFSKMSIEEKETNNEKHRGKNNGMYGKKRKEKNRLWMLKNNPNKGKKHSSESRLKMSVNSKGKNSGSSNPNFNKKGSLHYSAKKYIVTTPDGEEILVHGLGEFCRQRNLIDQCLGSVARGITKHHKGYKCRRHEDV
jgi:group I intron endonuclease